MKPENKTNEFQKLCRQAQACYRCDRMQESKKVIGSNCGSENSDIMIIGEAPGRRGADQSLIPFKGDKSGDNFEYLIKQAGLNRTDFFITNALLCNPKVEGRNGTPLVSELKNCNHFLKLQVDLVDPKIIITLGNIALKALAMIEEHPFKLKTDVAQSKEWYGRTFISLYHPGQRAMLHRSMSQQISDYQYVGKIVRSLDIIISE